MGANINKIPEPLPINTIVKDDVECARINDILLKYAGKWEDGRPNFRVVWSDDQIEKRWVTHTGSGLQLIHPVVKEVKKYGYIKERYVMERLVPIVGETDLTTKTSYEPCRVFADKWSRFLPPRVDVCIFVIDSLHYAAGHPSSLAKYSDPMKEKDYFDKELSKAEEDLFGNESDVTDALAYKSGIVSAGTTQGPITRYQHGDKR